MRGSVWKRSTVGVACASARSYAPTGCSPGSFTWAYVVDAGRKHAGTQIPPSRLTVGDELLDRWLPRTRTGAKIRTDRELHLRVSVAPHLGGLTREELRGEDLTYLNDDLTIRGRRRAPHPQCGHGLSPITFRHSYTVLLQPFADSIRWERLERNPCDRAGAPSTSEAKILARRARHTCTWDELARFLDVASNDRLFAMWYPLITTGMRRSAVAVLLWRNLVLDAGLLSVTRAAVEIQGKRGERIALHGSLRDVERVFISPTGDRLHPPSLTRAFHALTYRAGRQRIRLHDDALRLATLMHQVREARRDRHRTTRPLDCGLHPSRVPEGHARHAPRRSPTVRSASTATPRRERRRQPAS